MKTFIRLIALFLVTLFSFSVGFAYDLNSTEKYKLDIIVQKLEVSISSKWESYRSIYISKLNELKTRTSDDKIITYINYVIESLNKSLDIFNIFWGIDNQYPGCSSTNKYINWHTYALTSMYNWETSTISITSSIDNWYDIYRQTFTCSNWIVNNIWYESYVSTTCNTNYSLNWRTCIQYYNINRSCDTTTQVVNWHTYYLSSLSSWYTYSKTTSYNISGWYDTYKQSFSCYNWSFSTTWGEEYISTNCNTNYSLSWRTCYYNYWYYNNYNNYNYSDCNWMYKYYNGNSTYVDFLYNWGTRQVSFNIWNWYRYITYRCSNWSLIEDSAYTTCNTWYYMSWNSCYYNNYYYNNNNNYYYPVPYTPPVNNCVAVSSFLVWTNEKHSYPVPAFNANTYTTQTITVNVYWWLKTFSQSFYCSNWTTTITVNSPEILSSFTCNAWFQKSANWSSCEKIMENASCRAHSENVNWHTYYVPAINSWDSTNALYSYNYNWVLYYQQMFSCNNWVTSRNWNETINSCMQNYDLINWYCVPKQ